MATNDLLKLNLDPSPLCPHCNQLSRPNVLMFDDWEYLGTRYNQQIKRYEQFK
jgi:hypothetical protein